MRWTIDHPDGQWLEPTIQTASGWSREVFGTATSRDYTYSWPLDSTLYSQIVVFQWSAASGTSYLQSRYRGMTLTNRHPAPMAPRQPKQKRETEETMNLLQDQFTGTGVRLATRAEKDRSTNTFRLITRRMRWEAECRGTIDSVWRALQGVKVWAQGW